MWIKIKPRLEGGVFITNPVVQASVIIAPQAHYVQEWAGYLLVGSETNLSADNIIPALGRFSEHNTVVS